jgi:dextranase
MLFGCNPDESTNNESGTTTVDEVEITTDKSRYSSGKEVVFSIDETLPSTVKVRYWHLDEVIEEETLSGESWTWTAPETDFTGYLVDIYEEETDGSEKIYGSVAVDVSSDWTRFPRYGFLSDYGQKSNTTINYVIEELGRYHINGIQFYDCQYKHHLPLAGTVADPDTVWTDIANRDTYFSTVTKYIESAHEHNMSAMFYNLAFGALEDAKSDGVQDEWYIYTDNSHGTKDVHELSSSIFKSSIWLTNPANSEWQQYIADNTNNLFDVFDFDGFHIDQLGNRNKSLYTYDGSSIDLPTGYGEYIKAMQFYMPDKNLVMNAVSQYGQEEITNAGTDFLYSEVWDPYNTYEELASVITENNEYCNDEKNSVLAAYMDYNLADYTGYFNTPGVLLADAVIFAFGGAHIELGEHMLGKEYFPNDNLQMEGTLRKTLIKYYDFVVAYQNLLRDGGNFNEPEIKSIGNYLSVTNWPPKLGSVAVVGKEVDDYQVIHLLNFTDAESLEWRDSDGSQATPKTIENFDFDFCEENKIANIWYASPDYQKILPQKLDFTQSGNSVTCTIPYLQYWGMLVVELEN